MYPSAQNKLAVPFGTSATVVQLVEKAIQGDQQAYVELILRHERRVFSIAYGILRCQEDAEDIQQQVFLRVFLSLKDLKQPEVFTTWLHRVTINCALTHYRYLKSLRIIREADLPLHEASLEYTVATQALNRSVGTREMHDIEINLDLNRILRHMQGKERRILEMKAIEGLSVEEISRRLNLTIPSVKSRLYRSRVLIRRLSKKKGCAHCKSRNYTN